MPFKSEAQRRKFYALKREGKMDQKTIDEWEKDTPKTLPERVKKAFEQTLHGGLADNKSPKSFNYSQLKKGRDVEMEHTDDPRQAQEIAMDHLAEDPKYYDKLEKIEKEAMVLGLEKVANLSQKDSKEKTPKMKKQDAIGKSDGRALQVLEEMKKNKAIDILKQD